ncbi:hypothetical protein ACTXGQ_07705 [Marinobacter sp. 1Y8]
MQTAAVKHFSLHETETTDFASDYREENANRKLQHAQGSHWSGKAALPYLSLTRSIQ